jgi:psiF repeat
MLRKTICLAAALVVAGSFQIASAQTTTAPATTDAKPSRMKLTVEKLKEMRAKWVANRPKMKACRAEVKAKGLAGDDRWFYMEDCMNKT